MEEISYANPQSSKKSRISKRLLVFGGLFIVVLILLGSAIYFITRDTSPQEDEVTKSIVLPDESESSPTPTEEVEEVNDENEAEETPTPTEEVEEEITISVQNGSGVQGVAGEAAGVLRDAGYTVSSTTNADNTNYTDVTIRIKQSKRSGLAGIEEALSADYTIGNTTTDLPESTSVDAIVIIGS